MRRSVACPLLCALLLLAAPEVQSQGAAGAGSDYGLENPSWNGLRDFVRLAQSRDIVLRPVSTLDYGTLGPNDRLVVIYPLRTMDADPFARFVVDGGRVLLADDFGASEAVLERLDIARVPAGSIEHASQHLGRPGLPIFRPGGKHPLLEGVEEVVANHPAGLRTRGGAILPYDDDTAGLVYDMRLGRGKVIVVGDASIVINHMLQVGDNRIFMENALKYLCEDVEGPCRPWLLVGDAPLSGEYVSQSSPERDPVASAQESLSLLNQWLEELAAQRPPQNALYFGSILLMIGVVVFSLTVFSWRRGRVIAPKIGPPDDVGPLSEFEWNLLRYRDGGFQVNHALPMSILKTEFERLFFREMMLEDAVPPADSARRIPFMKSCAQQYVARYHPGLKGTARLKKFRRVFGLLRLLSRIPPRHRLFLDSDARFSERELLGTWRDGREILDVMGVGDEYEQRTRRGG